MTALEQIESDLIRSNVITTRSFVGGAMDGYWIVEVEGREVARASSLGELAVELQRWWNSAQPPLP